MFRTEWPSETVAKIGAFYIHLEYKRENGEHRCYPSVYFKNEPDKDLTLRALEDVYFGGAQKYYFGGLSEQACIDHAMSELEPVISRWIVENRFPPESFKRQPRSRGRTR